MDSSRAARNRARVRRVRRRLVMGSGLLLAIVLALASAGYGYVHFRFGQVRSVRVPGLSKAHAGKPFDLLVVGSDARAPLDPGETARFGTVGGQRNDVTMVVRVEPAARRVSLLSIPRDLVVPLAGGRENRINAALAGGPGQLVQTVERDFGIPIHHYLLIDFDGFQAIINALGGIHVRFPYPSRDVLSGLDVGRAGCVHLNGGRALGLARSRHFQYLQDGAWRSDPTADLGRIKRQHAFMQAVIQAALSKGLANPIRANAFVGALVHEITKDSALKVGEAIRLAATFRSFRPSRLATYTLPVVDASDYRGLGAVLLPKRPDAERTVDRFLGRPPPATPAAPTGSLTVTILNGLGTQGLAARTTTALRQAGYQVESVGNAPAADRASSTVGYAPGRAADAQALTGLVVGGATTVEDPSLQPGHLALVLGPGFGGLRRSAQAAGAAGAHGAKPARPKPPPLDLRDYDPRPC
jgi:polyisoprenyl-teichoic acid--peptidoglycan teichoic acid transferase